MINFIATILKNNRIARGVYELVFECPSDALMLFKPGQFAHIRIPAANELILRRPFSVCSTNRENGTASVIYQIAGEGTARLSRYAPGKLDVLMPLGNGFPADENYKSILLIGGGIGIAPLKSVTEQMRGRRFDAVLGFKSKEYAYLTDYFQEVCGKLKVTSDDGSIGAKGFVTDALRDFDFKDYDAVFACGPTPMFRALKALFADKAIPVYASLEERMGCGMGGCAVCVCKVQNKEDFDYKKVCVEGPVFLLSEVVF